MSYGDYVVARLESPDHEVIVFPHLREAETAAQEASYDDYPWGVWHEPTEQLLVIAYQQQRFYKGD